MAESQNQLHIPFFEKLKSIPEVFGIRFNEEPKYDVLKKEGPVEVRRYAPQLLAKVTINGSNFDSFRQQGFMTLAKYIFGGNRAHEKMAMTSPVLQQAGQQAGKAKKSVDIAMTSPVLQEKSGKNSWTMSFVLPSEFNLSNVPKPLDSQVQLEEIPGFEAATIRYSGNNRLENMQRHEQKLQEWLGRNPGYKKSGGFYSAQYDQPFVVPFLKRNEVQIKVLTNVH